MKHYKQFERFVASWVPIGAVPFFALALLAKSLGDREAMRHNAAAGARVVKWWRARLPAKPRQGEFAFAAPLALAAALLVTGCAGRIGATYCEGERCGTVWWERPAEGPETPQRFDAREGFNFGGNK